ncbi:BnaA02g09900D [Brassica napus]|uniref:BnaA02g09900D protein n=1 Tax=Brassica napus TaxID=3708 RepID=A0A078GVW8_BRANA|nr:BnaA02g09900D [Brassica napus]
MEKPMFKTVQEVIAAGEGVSERYLHTTNGNDKGQPLDILVPEMDITAVDLNLLLSSSDDGREELSKLYSVLSKWGVVQCCLPPPQIPCSHKLDISRIILPYPTNSTE